MGKKSLDSCVLMVGLDQIEELSIIRSYVRSFVSYIHLLVHSIAIINTFGGRHETTTHEFLIRKRITCVYISLHDAIRSRYIPNTTQVKTQRNDFQNRLLIMNHFTCKIAFYAFSINRRTLVYSLMRKSKHSRRSKNPFDSYILMNAHRERARERKRIELMKMSFSV